MMQNNCSNDVSGDTTSTTEVSLLWHVNIGNILILAQERQVEDDFKGLSICGENNEVSDTSVQAFCGLISTLLGLLIEGCLVAQVNDLLGQLIVSLGPSAALTCGLASVLSLLSLNDFFLIGLGSTLSLLLALL